MRHFIPVGPVIGNVRIVHCYILMLEDRQLTRSKPDLKQTGPGFRSPAHAGLRAAVSRRSEAPCDDRVLSDDIVQVVFDVIFRIVVDPVVLVFIVRRLRVNTRIIDFGVVSNG